MFEDFKNLSVEDKKKFGRPINHIKTLAKKKLIELSSIKEQSGEKKI